MCRTWDTPVRDILGDDFQLYDDTLTSLATVGDLLSHRLGLPGYFLPLLAGSFRNKSRKDMSRYHIALFTKAFELNFCSFLHGSL